MDKNQGTESLETEIEMGLVVWAENTTGCLIIEPTSQYQINTQTQKDHKNYECN